MVRTAAPVVSAIVILCMLPVVVAGQRGRQGATGEKPKVDIVQSIGCAEHRTTNADTWWLTRASDPAVAQPAIFSAPQVEAAKSVPLGANSFQLIGVADF